MRISLYSLCFNEKILLPFISKWWKSRIPNIELHLLDNMSDDGSKELAKSLGWGVTTFDTKNIFDDVANWNLKNHLAGQKREGWTIINDFDEALDITLKDLEEEYEKGTTIISTRGYNMVNLEEGDTINLENIKHGVKAPRYSKSICIRNELVTPNYDAGGHNIYPKGEIKFSDKTYNLCHFKYLNEQWLIDRYKLLNSRVDEYNKKLGHALHYSLGEEHYRNEFKEYRSKAIKIL